MAIRQSGFVLSLLLLFSHCIQASASEPPTLGQALQGATPSSGQSDEPRFEFCGEFDIGHGGAYGLALNPDASRLYVVGESSWLDILDVTDPSAIRSLPQKQFAEMPFGEDGNYGIAYDPHFQRVVVGGGFGTRIYLIDVSGDQLRLLDAAYPPQIQFPSVPFPKLRTTPPIFIKEGTSIAAAFKTGGFADDPASGQKVYFGEGVYLLPIDPESEELSVADEGIGGTDTIYGQFYDGVRDLLWCGGEYGAEAIIDFSGIPLDKYRYWSFRSGEWRSRVTPDAVTRDGKWLIERVASLHPPDHWFIRVRQIEAVDASYLLWNVEMPTDGATPHLLGSPINWNGNTEDPGSRISSVPLLPAVLTHDETRLITAEAGGDQLLILDLTDKTVEPQLLFAENLGDTEQIQSIKAHRNRFYVALKSGKVVVYRWNFVQKPEPPSSLTASASLLDQSIVVSWSPPSTGVTPAGYNVYRKAGSAPFQKVATVVGTSWTDECTTEDMVYTYLVRSFAPEYGPVESDDSPQAEATAPTNIPPGRILGLTGEPTLGAVALNWKGSPEADVVGYNVYRRTDDAPFTRITPSPLSKPLFLDADLGPGQAHSYCVTAVDSHLESPLCDSLTLFPADHTPNLLLNPGAEEQSMRHWSTASTTFVPDPANRFSFDNDLFIAVTNGWHTEGQWAFSADQTAGRYDRETGMTVDEPYFLAAYQKLDVSAFSGAIDSSGAGIAAEWGGQVIRATQNQSTIPFIAIEFLDATQAVLERHELSSDTVGEWVKVSSKNAVPRGTRSIRFWMFASDASASPANAAWDNLELVLREELPPQPLTVTFALRPSGASVSFGPTAPGRSYQIEYAEALPGEPSTWKPCGPAFSGNGGSVEWLDSPDEKVNPTYPPVADAKQRFYRVRQQ